MRLSEHRPGYRICATSWPRSSAAVSNVRSLSHFNRRFAQLPPRAFIEDVLVVDCQMKWLLVGEDFRFGAKRAGNTALLADYAARGAFELEVMPTLSHNGERISSTAVRQALAAGDLHCASALLDRSYTISGRVLHGRKLGRSLGFPTLNLKIEHARPGAAGDFRRPGARRCRTSGGRRCQYRFAPDARRRRTLDA